MIAPLMAWLLLLFFTLWRRYIMQFSRVWLHLSYHLMLTNHQNLRLLLPTAGIEPGPPAHYSIASRLLRQTFSRRKVTAAVGSWEGRVQATHYRVPNSPRIDSQTVHPADPSSFNDVRYVNSFNWWINLRVLGFAGFDKLEQVCFCRPFGALV